MANEVDSILSEVNMALESALVEIAASGEVEETLIHQVQVDALQYVYEDYSPKYGVRRFSLIQPRFIEVIPNGVEITVKINIPLQHSYSYWTGALTAPMVTGGWKQFKQPYARPFFSQERLQQALDKKVVEMLRRRGFSVQG